MSKIAWLAAAAALLVAAHLLTRPRSGGGAPAAPASAPESALCAECHEEAQEKWLTSHHRQAMQVANEETVLGDFDDATFTRFGVTSRFYRKDGRFFVRTDGADGVMADFEVKYTFGVTPLQQYLVALPGGRLQALSLCWDVARKAWFHLYDEEIRHDDPLHWSGALQNWNYMCAECHSTNLRKGYDVAADAYATTWDEINVGCQACHGPGAEHIAWARRVEETGEDYGLDDPKGLIDVIEPDTCARCHSRRRVVSDRYEHGKPVTEHYAPSLLVDGLYHADGQILEEVYVYGSFVQSKMHMRGVTCNHCHDPHSGRIRLEGNLMCARCHKEDPPTDFGDGLKSKDYDRKEHHFHEPGAPGSFCIDCHAPPQRYMQIDPRYDHSFRIPRPDLTVRIGAPNACNMCHDDKTAAWSVEWIDKWYPEPARPFHYGEAFAAARANRPEARDALLAVATDKEQPPIVRATAVFELRRFGPVDVGLDDPDPLARGAAAGGAPPERVRPLLQDPSRWVRTEAARVTAGLAGIANDPAFRTAFAEFEERETAVADRPGAHLNLGVAYAALGRPRDAERAYRTALRVDPSFLPVRFNLANLYNALGRNADAERELTEVLARDPESGDAHYSLALLLAELRRVDEAEAHLAAAVRLLPDRPRIRYNHALALQQLNRRPEAETRLKEAVDLAPRDPDIRYALVAFYLQDQRWKEAEPHARELAALLPGNADAQRLVERIERANGR